MQGFKSFTRTAIVGGLLVVLPIGILIFIFNWVFDTLLAAVAPLVAATLGEEARHDTIAGLVAVVFILFVCFLLGLVVKTSFGRWLHSGVEDKLLSRAPGYTVIKETLLQFMGNKRSPFSSVALIRPFDADTWVSGFVTDEHEGDLYTVFVPTGPNPTSGNIYHVKGEQVRPVDVPVESAMRSIISCGAGSGALVVPLQKKTTESDHENG